LLPAGATLAGRDLHPLKNRAFPRHTTSSPLRPRLGCRYTQPAAVYFYSPDRKAERPAAHLQDFFRGMLQVDGYAGFEQLTAPGDIVLAACWAHARRKFYDLHEATGSPIAAEALRRIAEL
jgi:hypothetical protein